MAINGLVLCVDIHGSCEDCPNNDECPHSHFDYLELEKVAGEQWMAGIQTPEDLSGWTKH